MIWLFVALGGASGALLRFAAGRLAQHWLPASTLHTGWNTAVATLSVNLLGSFCIGAFLAWTSRQQNIPSFLTAFFAVGLLGGFTTFSAFSREMLEMMLGGRAALAVAYATASVVLALGAVFAGYSWMR